MKVKGLRWVVLSLIVLVTIINYLDRGTLNYMWVANKKVVFKVVKNKPEEHTRYAIFNEAAKEYALYNEDGTVLSVPEKNVTLSAKNGSTSVEYVEKGGIAVELGLVDPNSADAPMQSKKLLSYITICFMIAYGMSQLVSGKVYDKVGTRVGFAISAIIWGVSDALTSLSRGLLSISFFRVMLGLGEAGPWPGTTKSNAEWFPLKERALAQGVFGAAASMGSILAPIIIPLLYLAFGWKATFVVVGLLGVIWIIPWLIINKKSPKEHPWITEEEKEYILTGQPESNGRVDTPKSWGKMLKERKNYAVILGRFFLDPIWWMFVTWLPIYLTEVFQLDIKQIAITAWVPYVGAAIGSISGGWFSGFLINRGRSLNFARKVAISIGATITLPAMIATAFAPTPVMAVLFMAFILGGFQFAIVNIQTLASDLQSGKCVGSLAGIGGAAAVLGVLITMFFVPYITQGGNWIPFFGMGALLVPLSVTSVFIFASKIDPLIENKSNSKNSRIK